MEMPAALSSVRWLAWSAIGTRSDRTARQLMVEIGSTGQPLGADPQFFQLLELLESIGGTSA